MPTAGDFGRGAATVDVENIRPKLLDRSSSTGDRLWIIAAQLHRERAFFGQEIEQVMPLEGFRANAVGVGHFGGDQPAAAHAQDHAAKGAIGYTCHRSQNDIWAHQNMVNLVAIGQGFDLSPG